MKTYTTYTVIGGDERAACLSNHLAQSPDKRVCALFLEQSKRLSTAVVQSTDSNRYLPQSDVSIFPLPVLDAEGDINTPLSSTRVGLFDCLSLLRPGTLVLAGQLPAAFQQQLAQNGLTAVDYAAREEFAVRNAIPTAEGAVEIALRETAQTLFGAECLVLGYGRIARVLVGLLRAFGARVGTAARRHGDLAWITAAGAQAIPFARVDSALPTADIIFNTVPAPVLGAAQLVRLKSGCLIIDLASRPGGVDREAAAQCGVKTIWALSLPGRTAPDSAGVILCDTIDNILEEKNAEGWQITPPAERRQK